jgi:phosphatidylserine/phosphatidylglycerophosphate/cardiolipin synthase-like enzyme
MTTFETAVAAAAEQLGPDGLRRLATSLAARRSVEACLAEAGGPAAVDAARRVLGALSGPPEADAAYLRGVAAGYEHRAARLHAELVWTGPTAHDVPVRATAQVLTSVIEQARRELILTTYSAKPYPPLTAALRAAVAANVAVWVVVETLHGAGSAIQGDQPAKAFADLPGIELWSWAIDRRPEGAKMHAKLAIADERTLLISSANLTTSGIGNNMEAGILVHGVSIARRAAEHLRALRRNGDLVRI